MRSKSIKYKYTVGIDEAGRGPLAGPVVVAAVLAHRALFTKSDFVTLRDSKKLSARQREQWYEYLTEHAKIEWAIARVWPKTIDRINIARATNRGVLRVCSKLDLERDQQRRIFLDGGLKLPSHIPHETIIKGDEIIPAIAAASIIAKVTRDRIMARLHKKYPQYRFDLHKGYGTATHRRLLQRFGYSGVHRQSFAFK